MNESVYGFDADLDTRAADRYPSAYHPVDLRDGRFAVFLVHRDTREWWRLIAVFSTWERAESYAGVENDCMDAHFKSDDKHEVILPIEPGDEQGVAEISPAPELLPTEPPTAVTPENFFPSDVRHQVESVLIERSTTTRETLEVKRAGAIIAPPWATQDDDLRRMWTGEWAVPAIAEALGRSVSAVYDRARHLKLGPHPSTGTKSPMLEDLREETIAENVKILDDPNLSPKRRAEVEAINEFLKRRGAVKGKTAAVAPTTAMET